MKKEQDEVMNSKKRKGELVEEEVWAETIGAERGLGRSRQWNVAEAQRWRVNSSTSLFPSVLIRARFRRGNRHGIFNT